MSRLHLKDIKKIRYRLNTDQYKNQFEQVGFFINTPVSHYDVHLYI